MVDRTSTICLLAVAAALMATASLISQTRSLVITRINVVDVTDGRILPDSTVTISGGTITSISRNGAPSPGAQVVDGQGKFLIPGLWDMHAHMEMSGESWLQLNVANGVTETVAMIVATTADSPIAILRSAMNTSTCS